MSLCLEPATTLAADIRTGQRSASDVMSAFYDQIERLDPDINAFTNLLTRDEALALAEEADGKRTNGSTQGRLFGLPMAIKDLANATPFPTTFGCPLFEHFVPPDDSLFVKRIKREGALIIGKTNVPEFGLGSHTFNPLFGTTRNPHDLARTAGGSSGGAAAALAAGMLPLADGSDLGGSLRNPAAFNGIFAIRPSVGRVPTVGGWLARNSVMGPMARNVADAALLLSVMAGYDAQDPISIREDGERFLAPLARDHSGTRLAWGGNLGMLEIDPEIATVCEASIGQFEQLGCSVEPGYPDLTEAMETFQTQRALGLIGLHNQLAARSPTWRNEIKETAVWNIEKGLALTPQEVVHSDVMKAELYRRMLRFFEEFDFLLLPTTQVPPFPVETEWVRAINGVEMATYIDWMAACCVISITGLPAASVPCGFTANGLPVGLQIVGKPHGDFEVLQLAYAFEQALGLDARPAMVR